MLADALCCGMDERDMAEMFLLESDSDYTYSDTDSDTLPPPRRRSRHARGGSRHRGGSRAVPPPPPPRNPPSSRLSLANKGDARGGAADKATGKLEKRLAKRREERQKRQSLQSLNRDESSDEDDEEGSGSGVGEGRQSRQLTSTPRSMSRSRSRSRADAYSLPPKSEVTAANRTTSSGKDQRRQNGYSPSRVFQDELEDRSDDEDEDSNGSTFESRTAATSEDETYFSEDETYFTKDSDSEEDTWVEEFIPSQSHQRKESTSVRRARSDLSHRSSLTVTQARAKLIRIRLRKPMGIVFESLPGTGGVGARIGQMGSRGKGALCGVLQIEDELINIDGRDMRSRDFVDIMEVMLEADVAQKLELVFRRKATRTFEA